MPPHRLSEREQRVLDEMERALRRDRRFDRRMRALRPGRRSLAARTAGYVPRRRTVAGLLTVSLTLMVTGIVTSAPAVIWAFAVLWPVTLCAVFRLLCHWTEGAGG